MKRRTLLKTAGLGAGTLFFSTRTFAENLPLVKTPRDAEGPFYPVSPPTNNTPDLLLGMKTARGKILNLKGQVLGADGRPRKGLVLDIWQADPQGRYQHPGDHTKGDRFNDFAYSGKTATGMDGRFSFRTYIPGAYGGRPVHIHYKIWQAKVRLLTSQIYFKGLPKGGGPIIQSVRHDLRTAVLVAQNNGEFETDFRIVV